MKTLTEFKADVAAAPRKDLETWVVVAWHITWALERAGIDYEDPASLEAALIKLKAGAGVAS